VVPDAVLVDDQDRPIAERDADHLDVPADRGLELVQRRPQLGARQAPDAAIRLDHDRCLL